ncbi:MAG: ribosome maturation factor RimM, partial [Pseudomonadota bacterium]|nr:ribosome maturation factor RimM [Pseudomonadota bacterium]
ESGTFYWYELVGLEVTNLQGEILGTVSGLLETGANDVLVVQPSERSCDQRERLIPYLAGSVVKQVSVSDVSLVVDWGIDYLS